MVEKARIKRSSIMAHRVETGLYRSTPMDPLEKHQVKGTASLGPIPFPGENAPLWESATYQEWQTFPNTAVENNLPVYATGTGRCHQPFA